MHIILVILFSVIALFSSPTQVATQPTTQEVVKSAPIQAPTTQLTYEEPTVVTQPAPVQAPAPVQPAPVQVAPAPVSAPVQPAQTVAPVPTPTPTAAQTTAPACEEDMPCWDCETMGNKVCGPTAEETTAAYAALEYHGYSDADYMGIFADTEEFDFFAYTVVPTGTTGLNYVFSNNIGTTAPVSDTWDCDTTGLTQCAGTLEGIGDAWESFDSQPTAPAYDDLHIYTYFGTTTGDVPSTDSTLSVKSLTVPNTVHIFTLSDLS